MGKYDKCDRIRIRVPVQFGKLSKRERLCYDLGYTGSLYLKPYVMKSYYRIHDSDIGAGRFFKIYSWKGTRDGKRSKDGKVWRLVYYINYREVPKELREKIEKGDEKIK